MAGTRRSARISSSQQSQDSSPPAKQSSTNGTGQKRKAAAGSSPAAKRGKKGAQKEQKTLEEVINNDDTFPKPDDSKQDESPDAKNGDVDMTTDDAAVKPHAISHTNEDVNDNDNDKNKQAEVPREAEKLETSDQRDDKKEEEHPKQDEGKSESAPKETKPEDKSDSDNAVIADARPEEVPSSILEKGILYILYRGRVNIDSPSNVQDIARTYIILRPLPHGAKLSDGPIGDDENCRLIAIPKKTLPITGKEKWTAFVEKAKTSFKDLKENFLKDNDYTTQTQGAQHTPSTKPAAEGVYAITSAGRDSHLAYIITLPDPLGEVQTDLGIRQRGSFVTSVKNPKAPGPANADLGRDPGYSNELQNEFRSLRWAPLKPDHLNYEACQFLMVGERENSIDAATEVQAQDSEKDKTEPKAELEKLEEEDERRVEHLGEEDAIYEDLGVDAKSYPGMATTW